MILFGHPTGNPNSHQAALAHFEAGRLAAFCVPWMPSAETLAVLTNIPSLQRMGERLSRRWFAPLADAPKIQGRVGEWRRLLTRALGYESEGLAYEANDWLMDTMANAAHRSDVTAVHSYEDAALGAFEAAKKLGKVCIYDMPIGFYPAWEETQQRLAAEFRDWLPAGGLTSSRWVRPQQKLKEMQLADLVLVPNSYVRKSIERFHDKTMVMTPYGVDAEFWQPPPVRETHETLRFVYAGHCSIRKGIPLLLDAWRKAGLKNARLDLIGQWQFSEAKRRELPAGVNCLGTVARQTLRTSFQQADVFVFPSYFEGFGLVVLEAMACGLPVISSDTTAAVDIVDEASGRIFPAGDVDALVDHLRDFAQHRDRLPAMGRRARALAELQTWEKYRQSVIGACRRYPEPRA